MSILVISTYPPNPCGIGQYASQQVAALRQEGRQVDVLSTNDGDTEFNEDLKGGFRILKLLKYLWAYQSVYIHYTPFFYFKTDDGFRVDRIITSLCFLVIMTLSPRRISFIVHETEYQVDKKIRGLIRNFIDGFSFRLARKIILHTNRERQAFADFYRMDPASERLEVWPQEKYYRRRCCDTREDARHKLGIEPDILNFLCLGFIQPHKNFDMAIEAFRDVKHPSIRLNIVGSVRIKWDVIHQHAIRLHELADRDPRCEIYEHFIDNETFDRWIVAADYIILPYNIIWSSAVAGRARLFNRPMLVSDAGGLPEQMTPGSHLFRTREHLTKLIHDISENHIHDFRNTSPQKYMLQPDS